MKAYTGKLTFWQLCAQSLRHYPSMLVALLPISLLLGLFNSMYYVAIFEFVWPWLKVVTVIALMLIQVYLWAVALRLGHARLANKPVKLQQLCRETWQRISLVYSGFFLSLIVCSLTFLVGYVLIKLLSVVIPANQLLYLLLVLFLISLPTLAVSVWCFMIVPQCALASKTVFKALQDSFRWVGAMNWLVTFVLYIATAFVIYLGYPDTHHMHWLTWHFLRVVFNLGLFVLATPLLVNYTLLLYRRLTVADEF